MSGTTSPTTLPPKIITNDVTQSKLYEWFSLVKNKDKLIDSGEALELIRKSIDEPSFDGFRFIDTMVTYQSALNNERTSLVDYLNAVRFCSYLEVYEGNATKAYADAFKDRDFVKNRVDKEHTTKEYKELSFAASRYRKNPIVVNILTQAEVPLYLMFQGYRYKAVARLVKEMESANLAKDRINAADRLLTHLKPPENLKIELDVGLKKDSVVDEYENMLANMVAKQKELLASGERLDKVANAKNEYVDVEISNE